MPEQEQHVAVELGPDPLPASWAWIDLATIRGPGPAPVGPDRFVPGSRAKVEAQPGDRVEPAVVDPVLGSGTEEVPGQHRPTRFVGSGERPGPESPVGGGIVAGTEHRVAPQLPLGMDSSRPLVLAVRLEDTDRTLGTTERPHGPARP